MSSADLYGKIKSLGGIADLSARAQIHLTGADRVRYLNGQVSNDVHKLNPRHAMPACVMTAKGKMCADIFITEGKDFLRVDAEPSLRASLAARLERYIISDDVTLDDVTEKFALLHVILPSGERSIAFGAAVSGVEPVESNRFGLRGIDLVFSRDEFSKAWDFFRASLPVVDEEMCESLRIEAGIPRWGFELGEETIPVEAGLERTAIDYHKGCYIGQEVISRLKSIGHVNRLLCGFVAGAETPLAADMRIFAEGNPEKEIGRITSAAYSFGLEKSAALGYLRRGTGASVLFASDDGKKTVAVEVRELPLIS